MRRALLAAALALAAPATAGAAPFGEPPSRAAGAGVTCLRATGEPGTLAYDRGFDRAYPGRTALLRADASGLSAGAELPATPWGSCTEVELRPNGAGIATFFFAEEPGESGVRVLLRAGGSWDRPVEVFGDPALSGVDALAAATSDAGAAVVTAAGNGTRGFAVIAVRRLPGGRFGPIEALMRAPETSGTATVRAGVTAAGETIVAWTYRPRPRAPRELWSTYAAPGGAFHAPVRVGTPRGPFALAVGDGGDAVLAFAAGSELRVAGRAAGAGFGPAAPVGVADDPLIVFPAAAVRADGAAVVGWVDYLDGAVRAVMRRGTGAFGAPVALARRVPLGIDRTLLEGSINPDSRDFDLGLAELSQNVAVTFGGDRALLAWTATARRDGVYSMAPSVATLPLAGGPAEIHALGGGLRDTTAVAPVLLADGTPAVAWSADGERRIHLSVEGAADAAEPPAPRVRIGSPARRVLTGHAAIVLPVTCSAACDLRASAGRGAWSANGELSLRRGGSGTLRLQPELGPLARLDGAPVAVHVRSGAPGTRHPRAQTVMVRVRRKPSAPLPRLRGVRARRDGDDLVVTWRTDRNADAGNFYVYAAAERRGPILAARQATGAGRRFGARLRDVPTARYATVLTGSGSTRVIRRTTVEIE